MREVYTATSQSGMDIRIERSQFIEHLADGVIVFDGEGTVIDVNPAYERMSRLSRNELLGMYGLDLARKIVSPADLDHVASAFQAAIDGNPIPAISIHFTYEDGSSLPVIFSTSFIKDESDATISIISVVKDVSDIRRIEAALRESEERLKSIITTNQDWIWAIDTTGRHTFSNPAILHILGYTPDEILAMDINSLLHEEDAPKVRELMARCIEQKTGWPRLVLRWKHRNGTYRYLESNAVPVLDRDGVIQGFQGSDHDITDLIQAEASLKESEEHFRSLADAMTQMVWIIDADGRIIYRNDRYRKYLGVTDTTGDFLLECIHPDDRTRALEKYRSLLASPEEKPDAIYRIRRHDGVYRWFLGRSVVRRGPDNRMVRMYCTTSDIDDLKKTEQALQESEEQFRSLADAMTQMVWIADGEGNSIYHNRRIVEYTGRKESTQAERLDRVHPEDRKGMEDKWKNAVASGNDVLEEVYRLRRHDGVYRWFIGRTILIRDADHRVVRLYGTATDIDDLKKAEQALTENLEMLARAEHIGKMGSWKQRVPGNEITLSDGIRGILGIPENEEISFDKVLTYIHPDDFAVLQPKIREILENGTPFSEEYRLMFPDGSVKYILGNAVAMLDGAGRPVIIHGSLQDITERKKAEEQIRSLLAEKELVLREVHHRIKNNMSTMTSLLALQANMTKEPAAVEALKNAGNRMKSMSVLYDKLYRVESVQELSVRAYLSPLVDEIIANFPNSAAVRVEKRIDDFVLGVKALSPVGMIVNELITNAMKHAFTGRTDGTITVAATLRDRSVTVSVKDNGAGIPESINIAALAGFGLQLVSLLAKQLHGTIRLERGEGTEFVLEFPA